MGVGAVVMAAGKGTRMRSKVPKVLHPIAGRPLVGWVLDALAGARIQHTVVVVGHGAKEVAGALPPRASTAVQRQQNGTGHATQVGLRALDPDCDTVIVLSGDTPLLSRDLIRNVLRVHRRSGRQATLVSTVLPAADSYGRVIRGEGRVRVVEAKDATPEELDVNEINAGLYVFDRAELTKALRKVKRDNAQGEAYLPDALAHISGGVGVYRSDDPDVVLGVNSRVELAECERIIQDRLRHDMLVAGVSMPDPERVYLDADVSVGMDSVIHPGVHLRAGTTVGEDCVIGPDVIITNCSIGDRSTVVYAHLNDSTVGADCSVGPFAYLRPEVVLEDGSKVGTYVELKKSTLGTGSKVPHLSYIGDATIGPRTNVGAGNITANYDGFRKHRTTIGAGVKTGSDCVFVAPVRIGDEAMTAAGSIITHDVPAGALGVARSRQENREGFTKRAEEKARKASKATGTKGAR